MNPVIRVEKLSKHFKVKENFPGISGAIKSLFSTKQIDIAAINGISFQIHANEKVAFIGPNGAGKSTTIKMLTGILHPSLGSIQVLDLVPWKNRNQLGYQIGTVFGQRSQLWYHLPPLDTFSLLSKIYEIDSSIYQKRLQELVARFEIEPFLNKPVKQLSLGERMRCEIIASLLHQPKILFLDEPTIGLDVDAKLKIRDLLNQLSNDYGITLFLTSHDTVDIEKVCTRVIVLDKGSIVLDNSLQELKKTYIKKKILNFVMDQEKLFINLPGITIIKNAQYHFICEIELKEISVDRVIHEVMKLTSLKDITIENPPMEEIIRLLYRANRAHQYE